MLRVVFLVLLAFLCSHARAVVYQEKETTWKEEFKQRTVALPTFQNKEAKSVSLTEEYCKTVTVNFWSGSSHPGGNKHGRLQESNRGLGFKCRTSDENPVFYSLDTMTNSQDQPSLAMSIGKQLDLVEAYGFKLYVGGTVTAIYYGKRKPHNDVFGPAPLGLGGFTYDVPPRFLSHRIKVTVGGEQLMIPNPDKEEKGFIRLRSFNVRATWKGNLF